ncbi:Serine--tRNA ligase [Candidatus Gugararchaeum adminiculabundum]|nr:Serine--tRNA ligase [Candidatus Gugararchaeum adminiculabundum]
MLDLKFVRTEPEKVREALRARLADEKHLDALLKLDVEWRKIKQQADDLRSEKNKVSMQIAELKKAKKEKEAHKAIKDSADFSKEIEKLEAKTTELEDKMRDILLNLPNIPHESTPLGKSAEDNPIVRTVGKPTKIANPKSHHELGEELGLIDFERGSKVAGHRFVYLKGDAAKLERALISFMLDNARERGYTELAPPLLVTTKAMTGTGQLPKFDEELYKVERDGLWLIPTSEVPLVDYHMDEILEEDQLPQYLTAYTPCFRREAGAYGKDIKGILRQHQFNKIELVKFTTPETSYQELEKLVLDAEEVLKKLELPYRVISLCTADIGFAAAKTYDIEVWLPSQNTYREISSCSNCSDFQSRRANIRVRRKGKLEFPHTLNGSGIAVGRTLIAIMENYQQPDGSIRIPKALQKYFGKDKIEAKKK